MVGTEVLQPGHDPLPVARRLLRERHGKKHLHPNEECP
jgi:hypothetical protein